MAYLDDEDEEALRELAEATGSPETTGEAMRRAEARERLREREAEERETAEETPAPAPYVPSAARVAEVMREEDEAAERERAREPARAEASRIMAEYDREHAAPDAGPYAAEAAEPYVDPDPETGDMGMRAWQDRPNDPEPDFAAYEALGEAPPDDPEAMAAFDAENEALDYDPGAPATVGEAMERSAERAADAAEPAWSPLRTGGAPIGDLMPEEMIFGGPADEEAVAAADPWEEGFGYLYGSDLPDVRATEAMMSMGPEEMGEEPSEAPEMMAETPTGPATPAPEDLAEYPSLDEGEEPPESEAPAMEGAAGYPSLDDEEEPPQAITAAPRKVPGREPGVGPLDEGLPSQGDIDRERVLGGVFDTIGGLLMALGSSGTGRAVSFGPSRADRLEDIRREGIESRTAAKGEAASEREELAARSEERALDRASRESIARSRDELAREREERMGREGEERSERDRLRTALLERRTASSEADAASRIAERESRTTEREETSDPTSDVSIRARERLPALLAGMPDELRAAVEPELAGTEWSADDVAAFEDMPATAWRAWLTRRRGGGGPGGGAGAGGTVATLSEALRARGDDITDEEAAALGATGLRRRLGAVLATTGEGEIVDGVYGRRELIGAPGSVERRELRASVIRARRASSALGTLAEIHEEWGAAGVLPETAEASAAAALRTLMAYSTQLGETGIISPGEVESIRAELPNPATLRGMAPGAFARRLDAWRDSVRGSIEDDLEARGVSEESLDRALGWIATGRFGDTETGGAPEAGGAITVRDPDTGEEVPADSLTDDELAALEAAGYEVTR